jgi:hypothetical protein
MTPSPLDPLLCRPRISFIPGLHSKAPSRLHGGNALSFRHVRFPAILAVTVLRPTQA